MSGAGQLRFVVIAFCFLGGANLVLAAVQLALGVTPRLPPVLAGVGYIVAAWQLWRGSAIAQFVLAALSAVSVALSTLMGFLARSDYPLNSLLFFLAATLCLVCVYLLLLSRPLRTELKARRLLNHEAARIAFEKSMSEG